MSEISCSIKFLDVQPCLDKFRVEVSVTRRMAELVLNDLCEAFGEAWVVDYATGGTGKPRTGVLKKDDI